ncbi:hypothetical protein KIL84_020286 [Mauremys mutica]|uniref:Uncharacterized protein n=1 Tax=Mauremys mutica TaxID=74926 RepID=A0A9D3XWW8_9SAUR|nr:hypothetical protein KIL84_020286 [Mauremys mutica]
MLPRVQTAGSYVSGGRKFHKTRAGTMYCGDTKQPHSPARSRRGFDGSRAPADGGGTGGTQTRHRMRSCLNNPEALPAGLFKGTVIEKAVIETRPQEKPRKGEQTLLEAH